jgi:hypothetical protein
MYCQATLRVLPKDPSHTTGWKALLSLILSGPSPELSWMFLYSYIKIFFIYDSDRRFLWNVCTHLPDKIASYHIRQYHGYFKT